jgi:FlaA1/EpsC-like NDP-sugar epimerase
MIFPRRLFSRSQLVAYLINLPRWQKRLICVLTDIFFVTFALWFAFVLRLGYDVVRSQNLCLFLVLAPLVSIPIFIRLGLYRAIIRYIGSEAFKTIIHAITLSALFLTLFFFWLQEEHNALIPRSVVVIYWLLSILFVGGMRFSVRNFINRDAGLRGLFLPAVANSKPHAAPVVVYGAGAAGFELMGSLSRSKEFLPIAFLDDNPEIQGRVMSGYPIVSPALLPRLIEQHRIRYVLLAMPSVPRSRKQKIIDHLEILNVHVKTLPSVNELAESKILISRIFWEETPLPPCLTCSHAAYWAKMFW